MVVIGNNNTRRVYYTNIFSSTRERDVRSTFGVIRSKRYFVAAHYMDTFAFFNRRNQISNLLGKLRVPRQTIFNRHVVDVHGISIVVSNAKEHVC